MPRLRPLASATLLLCTTIAMGGTSSCGIISTAPDVPMGPDRGDPAQYVLAARADYACNGWSPSVPSQPLGLFDIYFNSDGNPPASESLRRVVREGGTVISVFQVNGVRAILPIAAVKRIGAEYARAVTDLAITEHSVDVGFHTMGSGGVIIEQGGRVTWASSTIPDFFAIVPDAGIAGIRRDPDLRFLEVNLPACLSVN